MNDDVLTRVQQLGPIAEKLGLTIAQLSLAWVLQNSNVSAAIIGATRPEQVVENVKAVGVKLDDDVMDEINKLLEPVAVTDPKETTAPNPRA
jgi:aryl-alcohol dehydrogenase-like predicted oxidoreductase